MSRVDRRHLETIQRILEAIAGVEADMPRALVACDDARKALLMGFQADLNPSQVAVFHANAMKGLAVGE